MSELEQFFCPNEQCKDYGVRCQGNVAFRGKYGKDKSRDLLYCRTCGKRFASTHDSALFGLHLPADTIRQVAPQRRKYKQREHKGAHEPTRVIRNGCLIGIIQQAFEQERQHRQKNAIAQRHRKHRRN